MFPKWLFHKSEPAKIVHSEEEVMALGEGWKESPADFGVITHPNPAEFVMEKTEAPVPEKPKAGRPPKEKA